MDRTPSVTIKAEIIGLEQLQDLTERLEALQRFHPYPEITGPGTKLSTSIDAMMPTTMVVAGAAIGAAILAEPKPITRRALFTLGWRR